MPACKIPITALQPGMYVVDTGLPWTKAPLLYAEEGPIASRNEVERIIAPVSYTHLTLPTKA